MNKPLILVKISNGYERFWVIKTGEGRGIVDNDTVYPDSPRYGEEIEFNKEDIRDVLVIDQTN